MTPTFREMYEPALLRSRLARSLVELIGRVLCVHCGEFRKERESCPIPCAGIYDGGGYECWSCVNAIGPIVATVDDLKTRLERSV